MKFNTWRYLHAAMYAPIVIAVICIVCFWVYNIYQSLSWHFKHGWNISAETLWVIVTTTVIATAILSFKPIEQFIEEKARQFDYDKKFNRR